MNIKATRKEINECLTRAIERVLMENIDLVGTDDELDDEIELPEENPDDNADVTNIANLLLNARFLGVVFLKTIPLPPEISILRGVPSVK